jgi:hypothetical protein
VENTFRYAMLKCALACPIVKLPERMAVGMIDALVLNTRGAFVAPMSQISHVLVADTSATVTMR